MTHESFEKVNSVMIKLEHHNETIRRFEDEWLILSKETLIRYLSDEEREQLKQQIFNRMQKRKTQYEKELQTLRNTLFFIPRTVTNQYVIKKL